jgi:hypothetical protein
VNPFGIGHQHRTSQCGNRQKCVFHVIIV